MQAAACGQEIKTRIHISEAVFLKNAARGWVVSAHIGEDPARPRETKDHPGERIDGFSRQSHPPERRRDNIADFDVPRRSRMSANKAGHWPSIGFLDDRKDERRSIGVITACLHNETLRLAGRIRMRNYGGHLRDL